MAFLLQQFVPTSLLDLAFLGRLRAALTAILAAPIPADDSDRWAADAARAVGTLVHGTVTVSVPRPGAPSLAAGDSVILAVEPPPLVPGSPRVICQVHSAADADRARILLDVLTPALAAAAALRATGDGVAHASPSARHAGPVTRTTDQALREHFGLTARQVEVVALLLRGRRNTEIAATLGTSEATARHHTERVLAKLGARSRAEVPGIVAARLATGAPPGRPAGTPTPASSAAGVDR